ncbi:ankyrin repeat domain-containing protein [Ornithinibacillus bavariensis]|uniref:ankyrin repeat domain-containing protein n=1 Tax=Ornithinibacillus bavariensis TaxID=545502 RepID=UPI000EEC77C8|nr:hypothetical protein [Ornithinibacillus sp.]
MKNIYFLIIITSLFLVGCTETEEKKTDSANIESEVSENVSTVETAETKGDEVVKYDAGSLIQAVENNDIEKVKNILLDTEYKIDETNEKEETPLLIATHNNQVEIAQLLIDHGANINQQDAISDSPYLYAAAQGKTEILSYMIEHSNPDQSKVNRFGGNALIPAAEKGHLENVRLLLKDGKVNINHQNNFGYTALIEAVALRDGSKVYQDIVAELLKYSADRTLRDNDGKTAEDYARELGYTQILEQLQNR